MPRAPRGLRVPVLRFTLYLLVVDVAFIFINDIILCLIIPNNNNIESLKSMYVLMPLKKLKTVLSIIVSIISGRQFSSRPVLVNSPVPRWPQAPAGHIIDVSRAILAARCVKFVQIINNFKLGLHFILPFEVNFEAL